MSNPVKAGLIVGSLMVGLGLLAEGMLFWPPLGLVAIGGWFVFVIYFLVLLAFENPDDGGGW